MSSRLAAAHADSKRRRRLVRAQNDLYWLCSEVLGYRWNDSVKRGMTVDFHGPLCARMDLLREKTRVGNFWPRGHLKTTILTVGLGIQEILRDPNVTILVCHAVEEEANKIVGEMVNHFANNKQLRSLLPDIMPHPASKKWWKTDQFTIKREKYNRQPTVMARSAQSEFTGAHCDLILLDDIIARRTIENSELPKVATWYKNTIMPVLNPGGRIRVVGTRWSHEDIYGEWISSSNWDTCVRAVLEDEDGNPDYKGRSVLYPMKLVREQRLEMGQEFAPQMMNDPSPAGEKPWDPQDCEHYSTAVDAAGPGTYFVLSDPAPAKVGSFGGQMEKERRDGSKDDWSTCVVKIMARGARQEIHLVDGSFSKEWTKDEGFIEMCRLAKKWNTPFMANEATGMAIALYEEDLHKASRRVGIGFRPVKLSQTYKGKNMQFGALASRAKAREFYLCETCPQEFVDRFLAQAREWRPLASGKNSLKYDDVANNVSFAVDPSLQEYAPQAIISDLPIEEDLGGDFDPFGLKQRAEDEARGALINRHIPLYLE